MRTSRSLPVPLPYILILLVLLGYGIFKTVAPISSEYVASGSIVDITRPNGSTTAYAMVVKSDISPVGTPVYYTFDLPEGLDVYEVETWESWHPDDGSKTRRDSLREGQTVKVRFTARTFNADDPTQLPGLISPIQVQIITSNEGN